MSPKFLCRRDGWRLPSQHHHFSGVQCSGSYFWTPFPGNPADSRISIKRPVSQHAFHHCDAVVISDVKFVFFSNLNFVRKIRIYLNFV